VSSIRRLFGLDGVDLAIHAGVTIFLMILGDQVTADGQGVAIVGALSMVVLGIRRQWALRHRSPETTGEVAAERLAELESRIADVDHLQFRVQELEERLDFAERLLAQVREPERLP
jgi:hypothetical protein